MWPPTKTIKQTLTQTLSDQSSFNKTLPHSFHHFHQRWYGSSAPTSPHSTLAWDHPLRPDYKTILLINQLLSVFIVSSVLLDFSFCFHMDKNFNLIHKASNLFWNNDSPLSDILKNSDPSPDTPLGIPLPTSPPKDIPRNILAFCTITKLLSHIQQEQPFQVSWDKPPPVLYIIFVKFFLPIIPMFRFRSWRYFTSYWLFFHMLHFLHLYLFPVSSVFSNVPDFYMCSHSPFHMLPLFFPCALTLFTTFSKLLWHLIFLCFIFVTLPTYPDTVYKLMYLLSSSSVCKLMLILLLSYLLSKFPLSSQSSLSSLVALIVLW